MTEENEKRINIDDLPRAEKELSDDEEKGVTGGGGATAGILYAAFHGNDAVIDRVNLTSGNTVGGALGSLTGNTVGGSLSVDPSNPNKP